VRTDWILRPEIFWKPRSLGLELSVLSVCVVCPELRQRFMKAGAKYDAVKSKSSLLTISRVPVVSS
jgi:hypothetical protein